MKSESIQKSKDTSRLIHHLASHLNEPSESINWNTNYWFSWLSCISVMAILTYLAAAFLPNDIHLPQNLKSVSFWAESALWLSLGFLAAKVTSSYARPNVFNRWSPKLAIGVFAALIATIGFNVIPSAFASEVRTELHWMQGPCGFFIVFTGLVSALWMFYVVKKAAPVDLMKTSIWAAISVGSLGSFFMHLVCTHESAVHTFLWHVSPLFLLTFLCFGIGQKALRW